MKSMRFTALNLFCCALLFVSCNNQGVKNSSRALLAKDSTHVQQLIIGDPVSYSSDSMLLFPVGCNYHPEETAAPPVASSTNASAPSGKPYIFADREVSLSCGTFSISNSFDERGSSYTVTVTDYENKNADNVDLRNLVFYNKYTGESYMLLDKKLHILSFSIHHEFGKALIMYKIVKDDYNGDKKYDGNDPVMLFFSDIRGRNLKQITPENEQYLDYFYYKESDKMLLKVRVDGDKNKNFDPYDRTTFREINMKNPAMGQEVFGDKILDNLTKLL